jgi:hypothetical protein
MVMPGGRRREHIVDERAPFQHQQIAEAVFLRREELVERGL